MDAVITPPVLISVVMPVYNSGAYLRGAIESILNQTYSNFEFLIFNDGSTDDSDAIIRSYTDKRIVYTPSLQNMGYVHWLNEGIKMAKGGLLARMDSDDIALPQRFEKQVSIMSERPEVGVCGSWVQTISSKSNAEVWRYSEQSSHIKIDFLFKNPLAHPAVMMRKSLFTEHSLTYNADYFPAEDYHLWYQLQDITEFYNIPGVLLYYRLHDKQASIVNDKTGEATKKIVKLFLLHSGLSSKGDLDNFESIVLASWQKTEQFLQKAGNYYSSLAKKNIELKRFDEEYFNNQLSELFWKQCYFACNKNCDGLKVYRNFTFNSSYAVPVKKRFKAYIRSMFSPQ